MEGLKPPPTLFLDSNNLSKSWKSWRDGFKLYLDLTMEDADESKKVKLFSYLIGESGRELLDTLAGNLPTQERTVRVLIEKFDEHCNPSLNETVERYRFFTRNQGAGESIDGYVTDLRVLARTCNFGDIRDSLIRDRIVCGINNSGLRERLLCQKELTLDNCLQMCRAAELSGENNQTISGAAVEDLHAVKSATRQNQPKDTITCRFCGKSHEKNELSCPALVEARSNPFKDPKETPDPSCSQVKVEEDEQTDTCTSGEGSSGSLDQHCREFQKKTIKVEEAEDKDYLNADMEDTLKVFPCSSCSLFYTLQIDLNTHIKSCHSDIHEDQLTQGEIEDESLLATKCFHIDQTSSGPLQNKPSHKELQRKTHHCSECGKSFTQQSLLELHQCINTGEKLYHCPQCGKSFSRQNYLEQHQDIHTQEKKYHCSQCGKSFSQHCVLTKHQNIHTGERPYQCSQCEKSFTRQSHLKEHERIHTGEKPYHCLQCEKSFSQQSVLRKHQRLHTGERPYKCSQCGKRFTQQYHLEQHVYVHTGLKPYHCSQCGKGFSQKSYLKKHQRIHTGEKPYHCSQCGKNFTVQNRLTIHQRIHTGVRPYHCSKCGKSFTEQSNLKKHEHVHTGVKPYHCSQCGKSYTQQSSLICHQRIHTEENPFC